MTGIRNLGVAAGSLAAVALLMLYPTSTNGRNHRRPGTVAVAPGIVRPTVPAPTGRPATLLTVNGTSVDTAYGPVQVQIQLRAGRIVKAVAVDYPQGSGRDQEINGYAIPVLQAETLRAQSAQVDTVSGATYTSDGYRRSLQAALDAAHART